MPPRLWVASGLKKVQWTFLASSLRQQETGDHRNTIGSDFLPMLEVCGLGGYFTGYFGVVFGAVGEEDAS